jgi:hypothetical protein
MSKVLDVQLSKLKFPEACVVCMSPPARSYEVTRVFPAGRYRYDRVKVSVPMCEPHCEAANFKSTAEKLMGWTGFFVGGWLGLAATLSLLRFWSATEEGNSILNIFSGSIIGIGILLLVWGIGYSWAAPLLATPESKGARNAVKIKRYWAKDQWLRLEFEVDQLADMVQFELQRA